jgi:hypothetical protein
VTNAGDTGVYSLVFLDRFDVVYPQVSSVRGGVFEGEWEEGGAARVEGAGPSGVVLDVTDPAGVRWLTGWGRSGDAVLFEAEAGRRYAVVSPEGLRRPRVSRPVASTLRDTRHQADYVVIAPAAFLPAAEPLLLRRAAQGLAVKGVSFEEVVGEFGHSQPSAEAIRAFLSYAYHQWSRPSVRYVVLLGDASEDPRGFVAGSHPAPLPALWTRTSYLWTASDPLLAAVNGEDGLPDLSIGRLPATTVDEAHSLVSKLLAWEESGQGPRSGGPGGGHSGRGGGLRGGRGGRPGSFLGGEVTTTLKLRDLGSGSRPAILEAFDEGASLMSYVGHGGTAVWSSANVWSTWDVPSLRAQSRQPVLLTMNCLNGYFVARNFDSLTEALVKAEGRGAVAGFSPSGLSLDVPAHQYHRALVRELVGGAHERLGDAVLAAQQAYARTGLMPELLAIYHLLGDPATRIR